MDQITGSTSNISEGNPMTDTPLKIKKKYINMLMKHSPCERVSMACSMFETSKIIVEASIKEQNPNITESEKKKELFLRFYGKDFSSTEKEKILKHLARKTNND